MRFRTATTVAAIAAAGLLVLTGCADSGAPTGEEPRGSDERDGPVRGGHHDGRPRRGRHHHDRHQVRAAALRPRRARTAFPSASTSRSARSSPGTSASPPRTSSGSRPSRPTASRSSRAARSTSSSPPTRSTTSAKRSSRSPGRTTRPGRTSSCPSGNPEGIDGPEWFADNPDATVCTVSGSTSLTNIQEYTTNVLEAADYADCLDPIRNGQAVAVTTDNVILAGLADQSDGEFEVVNAPVHRRSRTASGSRSMTPSSGCGSTTSSRRPTRTAAGLPPGSRRRVRSSTCPTRRRSTATRLTRMPGATSAGARHPLPSRAERSPPGRRPRELAAAPRRVLAHARAARHRRRRRARARHDRRRPCACRPSRRCGRWRRSTPSCCATPR